MRQTNLLFQDLPTVATQHKSKREGAFTDNMSLPIHRWFRYSAGFSAEWVEKVLSEEVQDRNIKVLDPFVGSGTTLLACSKLNIDAVGFEAHPFICRIAQAKSNWDCDLDIVRQHATKVWNAAQRAFLSNPAPVAYDEKSLLVRCFEKNALLALEQLRQSYVRLSDNSAEWELVWLCITSILRPCSTAGTAQWQYILPNKTKSRVMDPFVAFKCKMDHIISDIQAHREMKDGSGSVQSVILTDARDPEFSDAFDFLITSPPYPNNYDYADSTRLEMTFWQEVKSWGDLQEAVRQFLIRSCTQHATAEKIQLSDILQDALFDPIREEITSRCLELERVRETKGGKKSYHTMAAAYFLDLANTLGSLRELMKAKSKCCFVIGDSAPYGVHLPVESWVGELAIAAGFKSWSFEKIRDRNIKWKNRKHTVPLKEGRLWIEG